MSTDGQHFDALVRFFRSESGGARAMIVRAACGLATVFLLGAVAPPPVVVRVNTSDPANLVEGGPNSTRVRFVCPAK